MSNAQLLQTKAAELPEPIAAEVLDFLEFVMAKRRAAESEPRRTGVIELRGSLKGQLSSTHEFSGRKAEEISREG